MKHIGASATSVTLWAFVRESSDVTLCESRLASMSLHGLPFHTCGGIAHSSTFFIPAAAADPNQYSKNTARNPQENEMNTWVGNGGLVSPNKLHQTSVNLPGGSRAGPYGRPSGSHSSRLRPAGSNDRDPAAGRLERDEAPNPCATHDAHPPATRPPALLPRAPGPPPRALHQSCTPYLVRRTYGSIIGAVAPVVQVTGRSVQRWVRWPVNSGQRCSAEQFTEIRVTSS